MNWVIFHGASRTDWLKLRLAAALVEIAILRVLLKESSR